MRTIRRLAVIVAILPLGLHAQAGQVVGPNGVSTLGNPTGWNPNVQAGATAQVTTTRPRLGFGGFGSQLQQQPAQSAFGSSQPQQ